MSDPVHHPAHYAQGWSNGAEVLDITENLNFNRGNAVKYIARAGKKDPAKEIEDLLKAKFYLQRELERLALQKSATGRSWALLDHVPPGVVVEDRDGDRYKRINGTARFMFAYRFSNGDFDGWESLDADMYDPGYGPYKEVVG